MGLGFLNFPRKVFINEKYVFIFCLHKCMVPVRSAISSYKLEEMQISLE